MSKFVINIFQISSNIVISEKKESYSKQSKAPQNLPLHRIQKLFSVYVTIVMLFKGV